MPVSGFWVGAVITLKWGSPPPESGEAGISGKLIRPKFKTTTRGFSGNAAAEVKPDADPACQCHLLNVICMTCRRWDRKINGINARRAESLRIQAMGRRAVMGL